LSKIKQIEINNFRIFKDKVKFLFNNGSDVFNLILLYGPNGYGKSSFFDAVEWSMTGDIRRFTEDKISKSALEDKDNWFEEKVFLTNRASFKTSNKMSGYITCFLDNDTEYKRTVKKNKKETDFNSGNFVSLKIKKENLKDQNIKILSQSQIDSFLRAKSDKEKFESLSSFFPDAAKASEYLKIIRNRFSILRKEIDSLNTSIITLEKNIQQSPTLKGNVTFANNIIHKLNQIPSIKFDEIPHNSDFDLDSFLTEIKVQLTLSEENIEKENGRNETIIRLINTLKTYTLNLQELETLEKEFQRLTGIDNYYLLKKNITTKIEDFKTEISFIIKKINDHRALEESFDYCDGIKNKIREIEIQRKTSIEEMSRLQSIISRISNITQKKKQITSDLENRLEKNRIEYNKLENNFNEYREAIIQKEKFLDEAKNGNQIVDKLRIEVDKCQIEKRRYELIKSDMIFSGIDFEINDEIQKAISFINNAKVELEKLKDQLIETEIDYKKTENFSENIDQMVGWAESYIQEIKTDACPLCNTGFKNMESLLQNIKKDRTDNIRILELKNEKSRIEDLINSNNKEKLINERIVLAFCDTKIKILSDNILELEESIRVNQNNLFLSQASLSSQEKRIKNIQNFFTLEFGENVNLDEDNLENFKSEKNQQVIRTTEKVGIITNNIERLNSLKLSNETNLERIKNELNLADTRLLELNNEDKFKLFNSLLNEYNYEKISLTKNDIVSIVTESLEIKKQIEENILKYEKEILESKSKIEASSLDIEEFQIESKKSEVTSKIEIHKKFTISFETEYKKIIERADMSEENLNLSLKESDQTRSTLNEIKEGLESLKIECIKIQKNVTIDKENKELTQKSEKRKKAEIALKKLERAKEECQDYIKKGVDNYFNKKTINEIYKKIEPHPNLKEIDFTVDFSKTDEAELKILAKEGGSDNDSVNPVLYLSSGQLNILSLSIFLAKALQKKTEIETIFMDDPIQNLSDINVLSFVDLIRTLISEPYNKQIVISTHDENFFRLLKNKLPESYYKTKYLEFESFGVLKKENLSHA
jgi:DNA repair exonuclease SbcCD ATPase subunit